MPHRSAFRAARKAARGFIAALVAGLLVVLWSTAAFGAGHPQTHLRAQPHADSKAHRSVATDPLRVQITSMSPEIPRRGRVYLSGTLTNTTSETWTAINLHVFASSSPLTDTTSLAASAATDPSLYVGSRITEPGTFATIESLAPGATTTYSVEVPVELLGTTGGDGVYWIGIHAFGDSSAPRDEIADGRARTFIPLIHDSPGKSSGPIQPISAAVVVPIRRGVWYAADGRVANVDRWVAALSDGGRLESLLDLPASAPETPLTWLIDPAVLDAIGQISNGNPPRDLSPDPAAPQPSPSPGTTQGVPGAGAPSAIAGGVGGVTPPAAEPPAKLSKPDDAASRVAIEWLNRFREVAASYPILALPYADIDASAAARHDSALLAAAFQRGSEVMTAFGIPSSTAIAPPSGVLSPEALAAIPPDTTVLVGDTAFAVPPNDSASHVLMLGHTVVVTSTGAASGGPAPAQPNDALALRQRLLSEAAVRITSGNTAPVVLMLPSDWRSLHSAQLLNEVANKWLRPVALPEITQPPPTEMDPSQFVYTDADEAAELSTAHFTTARALIAAGTRMQSVLTAQTTVIAQVLDEALAGLSTSMRDRPRRARVWTQAQTDHIDGQLKSIRVEAPSEVTLPSANGSFGASIVNGLDQPITVQLKGVSDSGLVVSSNRTVDLAGDSRTRLLLDVRAKRQGIHEIDLSLTAKDGTAVGTPDHITFRASQVSWIIWVIMAAGVVMLFGAIAVRLVRRFLNRHRDETPESPESSESSEEPGVSESVEEPDTTPAAEGPADE